MLRLVVTLSLLLSTLALDLTKYSNVAIQDISDKELGEVMEDIYSSETRNEDLQKYKEFLLENAKTDKDKKLVKSLCGLIKDAVDARRVLEKDASLYTLEEHKKMQEKIKLLPAELKRHWFADNFDIQNKDTLKHTHPSQDDTFIDSEGRDCRYVKVNEEEVEEHRDQAMLDYYHFLRPEEDMPREVNDDIYEVIINSAYSKRNTGARAKAAKDYGETVLFLENGLKKVYLSDEYDSIGQKKTEKQKNAIKEIKEDEEYDPDFEEIFRNEVFDEEESGRQYKVVKVPKKDIEKERDRLYLEYYHSLYPTEKKPLVVESAQRNKISNKKMLGKDHIFEDDMTYLEDGLKKDYLRDDEPRVKTSDEDETNNAKGKLDLSRITDEQIKEIERGLKELQAKYPKKTAPPKEPKKEAKPVENKLQWTTDEEDLLKKYEQHLEMGNEKNKEKNNQKKESPKKEAKKASKKIQNDKDPYDIAVEMEHLARSLEDSGNPVKRKIISRRYRLVEFATKEERNHEKENVVLQFYQNVYPDEKVPDVITEEFAQKMARKIQETKNSENESVQSTRRVMKKAIDMIEMGFKKEMIPDDEPKTGYELTENVWEWDEEDLKKRYQEHLKKQKRKTEL